MARSHRIGSVVFDVSFNSYNSRLTYLGLSGAEADQIRMSRGPANVTITPRVVR